MPIPFINQLLAKAIAKRAATLPIPALHAAVTQEYDRSAYITRVLEAPPSTRTEIKTLCLASDNPGQKQLGAILTMFEALSPVKKVDFIKAFKNVSTLAGQGPMFVALQTAWQWNHVPPIYVP